MSRCGLCGLGQPTETGGLRASLGGHAPDVHRPPPQQMHQHKRVCAVQSLETLGRTAFPRAEPVYPSVAAGGPSSHHPASKDEHKEGLTC